MKQNERVVPVLNPKQIQNTDQILIIGPQNSGKETLVKDLSLNPIQTQIFEKPISIPPQKIDWVFIFYTPRHLDMRKIYEQYGCSFKNYDDFLNVYYQLTRGHTCMVIDNRQDQIYWYKARFNGKLEPKQPSRAPSTLFILLDELFRQINYL